MLCADAVAGSRSDNAVMIAFIDKIYGKFFMVKVGMCGGVVDCGGIRSYIFFSFMMSVITAMLPLTLKRISYPAKGMP